MSSLCQQLRNNLFFSARKPLQKKENFTEHTGSFFDNSAPSEEDLMSYFKFNRTERKMASSSMWVLYSHVNVVLKNRYGIKLQGFPRITTLLELQH